MTDYYAVLKKAVSGFESESGDARRSVYDKARTALIGQLKSIDPPLTTSEISRQRLELEEAIRKVEREASAARPAPARVSAAAAVAEALAVPEEPAEPEYVDEPEDDLEEEVAVPTPPPAPPVAAARPRPAAAAPVPPPAPIPAPPPIPEPVDDILDSYDDHADDEPGREPDWHEPEPRQAPPVQPQWPQVSPTKPTAYDRAAPQGRREPPMMPATPVDEPRFEADSDSDDVRHFGADADWAPEPLRATPMSGDVFDEPRERRPTRRERNGDAERPAAAYVERAKPSRLPTLILLSLICLMLAGIAALAWTQRSVVKDVIGDIISSNDGGAKPTLSEDPIPTAQAPSKNADRLGGAPEEAAKTVRTVDAEPAADGEEADPLAGVMAPEGTRSVAAAPEPAPTTDAEAPAASPSAPAAAGSADESLVAQKAILYEQPTDGSQNVKVVNANVTWKFVANSPNGPEIQANLEAPEKGLKATLTIRKNNDSALPASHLVEIVVDTPANFAGGGVKSVPALVMKPTEESRGQPLDGAAAKVADGFFWIAFSNDAGPQAQNVALMRERNWIDLPLVYNNDQRAILTFEKGTPGQRVFDKAMTAWGSQ
ncbi:hypothetical protein [Kaistia terrae]|uniref:Uncharacterized protein n=1 Tax=Kaistia terrae TaxID=537017 RepID=A0ABW0PQP4_9HYPH|nr:hypothetical protein [Kaistia terrae]MCX5580182.1 hypothetical protein [Kaistia terrae]